MQSLLLREDWTAIPFVCGILHEYPLGMSLSAPHVLMYARG